MCVYIADWHNGWRTMQSESSGCSAGFKWTATVTATYYSPLIARWTAMCVSLPCYLWSCQSGWLFGRKTDTSKRHEIKILTHTESNMVVRKAFKIEMNHCICGFLLPFVILFRCLYFYFPNLKGLNIITIIRMYYHYLIAETQWWCNNVRSI